MLQSFEAVYDRGRSELVGKMHILCSAISVWEAAYLARAQRVDLGMLWEE